MDASSALSIVNGSSKNMTQNSTLSEEEILQRLEHALTVINLLQSRFTFVTALLKEGKQLRRNNTTQTYMDITHISNNCKVKLDELWSAVETLQIKTASLKAVVANTVALQLLSSQEQNFQQLSLLGVRELAEDILSTATRLYVASDKQKILDQAEQHGLIEFVEKQDHFIELIANVEQKIKELNSVPQYSEQLRKNKERIAYTKVARSLINCLLSNDDINVEENPELLAMKNKWRPALTDKILSLD